MSTPIVGHHDKTVATHTHTHTHNLKLISFPRFRTNKQPFCFMHMD